MTPEAPPLHLGAPVDEAWGTLPDGTRTVRAVPEGGVDGDAEPSVVVVRL